MEHVLDHEEQALGRLLEQYKGKPKLAGLIVDHAAQMQEVENALWGVYEDRLLGNAEGDQLDQIGTAVGQARGGLDDATYRLWISARIILNRSSGTLQQILAIAELVVNDPAATLELREDFPAAFTLLVGGVAITPFTAAGLMTFMRLAKAGGVRAVLDWFEVLPAEAFRFDIGPGLDQGKLGGSSI